MSRPADVTPCAIIADHPAGHPCREPAHVVLYSQGGEFAGQVYQRGQKINACLTHGGHILDARRALLNGHNYAQARPLVASWLARDDYLALLPLTKIPEHPASRRIRTGGKSSAARREAHQ